MRFTMQYWEVLAFVVPTAFVITTNVISPCLHKIKDLNEI
jgi:hypothetical protein